MRIEPVATNWIVVQTQSGETFDVYDTGRELCVKAWHPQNTRHFHELAVTIEPIVGDKEKTTVAAEGLVVKFNEYSKT